MSRIRTLFASLALTTSLVGCAVPHAEARSLRPTPVAPIKIQPAPQDTLRMQVRKALAERRKVTIERFLAYREARVYPVNSTPGTAHVWLDENGNLCAAATIIAQDWGRAASENVAKMNNHIALADVSEGELYSWILTSGMTHAEIVAIQVPGFAGGGGMPVPEDNPRLAEITRLYQLYSDLERQIRSLDKKNLDLAVDELMKHPQLARDLVGGKLASAGRFTELPRVHPRPATPPPTIGFAQPPPR